MQVGMIIMSTVSKGKEFYIDLVAQDDGKMINP